jgi:hypothetical protein
MCFSVAMLYHKIHKITHYPYFVCCKKDKTFVFSNILTVGEGNKVLFTAFFSLVGSPLILEAMYEAFYHFTGGFDKRMLFRIRFR